MPTATDDVTAADSTASPAMFQGRPLRVLMVTDCFPKPNNQSLGVWALEQARGLVEARAEVRVVSPTPWLPGLLSVHPKVKRMNACPARYDWGNLPTEYPRWPYYNIADDILLKHPGLVVGIADKFLRAPVRRLIRSWMPDVVFIHHTAPNAPIAVWIKNKFGVPFVTMDLDIGLIENARIYPGRRKFFAAVASHAYAATGAAKKISDSMQQQFPARLNQPLYMGSRAIDPGVVSKPRPVEWASKKVIFTAAGFFERKGIPELVKAFAMVAKNRPEMVLRIAGDGRCKPQIVAAIAESGVCDQIFLLGSLPHAQVIQEMVWSDLFMLIGWEEPFATVYLEAMSVGKPIICCADGGICEVMTDLREGIAVPPHDVPAAAAALERLISDDALRQQMGQAAYDLFERRLNSKSTALRTLELLHKAASSAAVRSLDKGN